MPAQYINDATRQKRLLHATALLRRLTPRDTKTVFFTDEKAFYLNTPVCQQNNRVWSEGKKADVKAINKPALFRATHILAGKTT